MGVEIESLFTAALGLQAPWAVEAVELNTTKRRIDFEVRCKAKALSNCVAAHRALRHRGPPPARHERRIPGRHRRDPAQEGAGLASPSCTTPTTERLLFATPGRDHTTLLEFAVDLRAHGGNSPRVHGHEWGVPQRAWACICPTRRSATSACHIAQARRRGDGRGSPRRVAGLGGVKSEVQRADDDLHGAWRSGSGRFRYRPREGFGSRGLCVGGR